MLGCTNKIRFDLILLSLWVGKICARSRVRWFLIDSGLNPDWDLILLEAERARVDHSVPAHLDSRSCRGTPPGVLDCRSPDWQIQYVNLQHWSADGTFLSLLFILKPQPLPALTPATFTRLSAWMYQWGWWWVQKNSDWLNVPASSVCVGIAPPGGRWRQNMIGVDFGLNVAQTCHFDGNDKFPVWFINQGCKCACVWICLVFWTHLFSFTL